MRARAKAQALWALQLVILAACRLLLAPQRAEAMHHEARGALPGCETTRTTAPRASYHQEGQMGRLWDVLKDVLRQD